MSQETKPKSGMGGGKTEFVLKQLVDGYCPLHVKGCERVLKMEKALAEQKKEMSERNTWEGRIEEKLDHGSEKFDTLNKFIEGNGQPGVVTRLTQVETKFWLMWTVMVLSIGGTVTAVLSSILGK